MKVKSIVIHCSDSRFGTAAEIRRWHLENGWADIGYHFVICNGHVRRGEFLRSMDGAIEVGRHTSQPGAHVGRVGRNKDTIGICLIGVNEFTAAQLSSLTLLLLDLMARYELTPEDVVGHGELDNQKTCPNFNVAAYRDYLRILTRKEI